jgi:hypothetical protein
VQFRRNFTDLSDEELRAYAGEHVLYEITQFVRATQAVEAAQTGLFPMNFAVEVLALHLRNLLVFFAPRNPWKTDACAHHFFKDWEPPDLGLYLGEARLMADKHVAHLTIDRPYDLESKIWAVEPIVWSLKPIIERFTEGADHVDDRFRESVNSILRELPPRRDWTEMPSLPEPATGAGRRAF